MICRLGSTGSDWRLQARFDPGRGCFADLVLTPGEQAVRVQRTHIQAGQIMVQDRGYARVREFGAVLAAGADFITRIGWRSLRLRDAQGRRMAVLAAVPQTDRPSEQLVYVKGLTQPLRLVIQRQCAMLRSC